MYSGDPFQPGSPFQKGRSPLLRPLLLVVVLVALGALGFVVFRSIGDSGDDSQADDSPPASTGPDPLEAESLDALEPALQAAAAEHETPLALWEVEIWRDRVDVAIQVPDEPEFVDRYTWRDGELSRPTPVELTESTTATMTDRLFGVEDVDVGALPTILDDVVDQHADHPETELMATNIYISGARLPDDPDVAVTVHAGDTDPDSDERWLLTYDLEGNLVRGP